MNAPQFDKLSRDLSALADKVPLHWGAIQNDRFDSNIDMFELESYESLEAAIVHLDETNKNYLRHRWYIWKCAQCDEYLFTINPGAAPNPNHKDKTYDVMFSGYLGFDIKSTIIPRSFRGNVEATISDPHAMIDFFYKNQSNGVRNSVQNRLFIIHHSLVDADREFKLRCAWETKKKFYRFFVENFSEILFKDYDNCKAGVIYLIEREKNKISCIIDGYNDNKPIVSL